MLPTIAVIAGTRSEAVKLRPVVEALRAAGGSVVNFIATGQHRRLFDQAMDGASPDIDLDLMQESEPLATFLARAGAGLRDALSRFDPALVIVQGDTATAYAGALAAFRLGIPLAHVEAGLRTASLAEPFPEELFRRSIARLATMHFAPTARARTALLKEGVPGVAIHITGNTGIDGLFQAADRPLAAAASTLICGMKSGRFGLVTIHRRENQGPRLDGIASGIDKVARTLDLPLILPLHPAPGLRRLETALGDHPLIRIVSPLDHQSMVGLLARAALILTDSGGLQEEAAALGTPAVVLRGETERIEAVEEGRAMLAGESAEAILAAAQMMLACGRFPRSELFGDGRAGERIAAIIGDWLRR